MKKLHALFVANYLKTKNASQAARAAGYGAGGGGIPGIACLKYGEGRAWKRHQR
jgi:phage terminase small subunit